MINQNSSEQQNPILQQAYLLRAFYPELFGYLVQRDKLLQRTLQRVPDPNDLEGWTTRADLESLISQLKKLPPGVNALAVECEKSAEARISASP
jgi:hypothetical protein